MDELQEVEPKLLYLLEEETDLDDYLEENGLKIVYPNVNQVFIDCDSNQEKAAFLDRWVRSQILLEEIGFFGTYKIYPSKTPEHWHIICEFGQEITIEDRLIIASTLGSDWKACFLSWVLLKKGYNVKTVMRFFEKKI